MMRRRDILRGACGAAALAWLGGCERRGQPASAPASRPAPVAHDWPGFRGGPDLAGLAPGALASRFALKWRFRAGAEVRSSPIIVGGKVYVGSDDGNLYCLAFADGRKIWSFEVPKLLPAAVRPIEAPPLRVGELVVAGADDGFLYAVGAETGELAWKYETGDKILGSANVFGPPGRRRILQAGHDSKVHCVHADSGERAWVFDTDNIVNGTPAVWGEHAVFAGCDGLLRVVALADGKEVRRVEVGSYVMASTPVAGDRAYAGNAEGKLFCIDLREGRTVWEYAQEESFSPLASSPALGSGRIVVGGQDRNVHCIDAATGRKLWLFAARGYVDSSPLICGDKVVVGSDDGFIYVLALADGRLLWSFETGQAVKGSAGVYGGAFLIGGDDGVLYAFEGVDGP